MSSNPSRLKIFEALTAENPPPIPFNDETVTFSFPQPASDPEPNKGDDWNTMVTLTAKRGSGYAGSVNVYYRRLSLKKFIGSSALVQECRFTPESLIGALNRHHDSFLSVEDLETIDETRLPCRKGVIRCISLVARIDSLGWIGDVTLPVLIGIPAEAERLHQLIHNTLPQPGYW